MTNNHPRTTTEADALRVALARLIEMIDAYTQSPVMAALQEHITMRQARAALASAAQPAAAQQSEVEDTLVEYAMQIAHERELHVLGHKHDSEGALQRFRSAVARFAAAPKAAPAPARWYMVNCDGMATLCADRQDAEREAADVQAALRTARAFLKWLAFGECRADGWEGPPPTAAEAVAAIESVLTTAAAARAAKEGDKT